MTMRYLPFPVGETYSDGVATRSDTLPAKELEGQIVETVDAANRPLKLRIVKFDTSVATSISNVFYTFNTTSPGDYGRRLTTTKAGQKGFGKPPHYSYNGDKITAQDLLYVVEEGYVSVQAKASHGIAKAGMKLGLAANGQVSKLLDGAACVAVAATTPPKAATACTFLVYVLGGIDPSGAGAAES